MTEKRRGTIPKRGIVRAVLAFLMVFLLGLAVSLATVGSDSNTARLIGQIVFLVGLVAAVVAYRGWI